MAREIDMTGTTLSSAPAPPQEPPPLALHGASEGVDASVRPLDEALVKKRRWGDDPRVPAWLVSTIAHTIFLIVLALLTYGSERISSLTIQGRRGEPAATLRLESDTQPDNRLTHDSALADQPVSLPVAPTNLTAVQSPLATDSVAANITRDTLPLLAIGGVPSSQSPLVRLPGGGLSGRTPEGRKEFGEQFGATAESERAVERALKWLADHQRPNGSWSFNLDLDPCGGRCRNSKVAGETPTPATGATGLALLAFLGAGYTHKQGPYTETVRRGIYYLRDAAGEAEFGLDWQQGSMYGHGIALMALAEALAMTTDGDNYDSDLKNMVDRGTLFTSVAQHRNGSWGYVPGSPGDTTLTGWQVLSLIAARRNGVVLRTHTLRDAKDFLRSTSPEKTFEFGYKGPPAEPTTTAIGLTLMLYLGQSPTYTPFYHAITEMAERGPTLTNVYHDYYATLALHHTRHPRWDAWNTRLRNHLVATQETSGHETGSWHFKDRWGDIGGRLYTTAMSAMILETPYRFLPMYGSIEDFPL